MYFYVQIVFYLEKSMLNCLRVCVMLFVNKYTRVPVNCINAVTLLSYEKTLTAGEKIDH